MKKRKKKKRPYRKPSIATSEAFYTRALACVKGVTDGEPDCGGGGASDQSFS